MNNIATIVYKLLNDYSYRVSIKEIHKRIESDPENEILSITNTLDFFSIQYLVAEIPKKSFIRLPKMFIARLGDEKKSILALVNKISSENVSLLFSNGNLKVIPTDQFLKEWSGLIIAVEKNTPSTSLLSMNNFLIVFQLLLILTSSIYIGIHASTSQELFLYLLSILGLYTSVEVIKTKFDPLHLNSKFCNLSKESNCSNVLSSSSAKLFNYIDLSDVSIVYFSIVTFSFLFNQSSTLFLILSSISLLAIPYSLYSQFVKIKKWCPLCLIICLVLLLQFGISFIFTDQIVIHSKDIFLFIVLGGTVIFGWVKIKQLLIIWREHYDLDLENLTFRRNHKLFLTYYASLEKIEGLDFIKSILFGNKNSPVNITIVTNPLCKSCYETYKFYSGLLKKYSGEVSVRILFLTPNKHRIDPRTQVAESLIQLYFEDGEELCLEAMEDWYETLNTEKWLKKWGLNTSVQSNSLLAKQVNFCLKNGIEFTPSILVNNRKFPTTYRVSDIEGFIEPIINFGKQKIEDFMHERTEALDVLK